MTEPDDSLPPSEQWSVTEVDGILQMTRRTQGPEGWLEVCLQAFRAVEHHYAPSGRDEPILLYSGPFTSTQDGKPDRPCQGTISFRWYPLPRIELAGMWDNYPSLDDLNNFLEPSDAVWVGPHGCRLPPSDALPHQPNAEAQIPPAGDGKPVFTTHTNLIMVGDTTDFDQVTFLIPNGPEIWDGAAVAVAADPGRLVSGHLQTAAAGWDITIDPRMDGSSVDRHGQLRKQGGHDITHVGRLRRSDGTHFDDADALESLTVIRLALSLATGRVTPCLLPVGWRDGTPVGARWNGAPTDPYRDSGSWIDLTIGATQLTELLQCTLNACVDPIRRAVVRQAVQLLVTANVDVDVELQVALPMSGLQMLSFYRFVTDQQDKSKAQFDAWPGPFGQADAQIRALLYDCNIDTTIPNHLQHLATARNGIDQLEPKATQRDALASLVYLRNRIIHPTSQLSSNWSIYQWAEAGIVARHYLTLALLRTLDYKGQIYSALAMPRYTGNVEPVPWAPTPTAAVE